MSKELEKLRAYFNHEIALSRPQGLKIISSFEDYIKNLEDRIDNLETSYLRNRKALEIFMDYVSFQEVNDDFFKYEVVDKQYVSNSSELLITDDEYKFIKEFEKNEH